MSYVGPSPQTTLVILLGASEWQKESNLASSKAFERSANKVRDYFSQTSQFGLPEENFLDLFDQKQDNPDEVDQAISTFLNKRMAYLEQAKTPARDLLFYYIGHGIFTKQDQVYHLAIRNTRSESLRTSAIAMVALAETLKDKARRLRRLVILDCCFSAEAFKYWQSDPSQAATRQVVSALEAKGAGSGSDFPGKGTTLLCSSSNDLASFLLPDESGTTFSEALIRALSTGNERQQKKTHLSLYDLEDLIEDHIERLPKGPLGKAPRPFLGSPDQREGDIATIPLFPNSAALKDPPIVDPPGISANMSRADMYHDMVKEKWADKKLTEIEITRLTDWVRKFRLSQEQVAAIEREVMGDTREAIWARQVARAQYYRREVGTAWANKPLTRKNILYLADLASTLELSQQETATIEREVMGEAKERILLLQGEQKVSGVTPQPAPTSLKGRQHLLPGAEISNGRYKIERLLATGNVSVVYRALDMRFGRPCVIKEMLDDYQNETDRNYAIEWFTREATLLLELNHPCIPHIRDFFREEGYHYLVMDFIEGRTMSEVLEKEGNVAGVNGARGVSQARAQSWTLQLCNVLSYLHRQSPPIIFRDLKPSNIMVTDKDEIKLISFGIAHTIQSRPSATVFMTVGYAPPEQLYGKPETRSDLYALGATVHRALTHHNAADNKPSIFHFPMIRTLRPDISEAFEQVIARALEENLDQRWGSAAEMERAVQPVSNPASVLLRQAQDHINAGRIEPAFAVLQQAYPLDPNNPVLHKLYGQVFARRQPPQPEMAMKAYNTSLQFNGNDAETHRLVGDVYLYVQRLSQAEQAYVQVLKINPADHSTRFLLAQVYERENRLEDAWRECNFVVNATPSNGAAQAMLQRLRVLLQR